MKLVLLPPGEFLMGSTDKQVAAAVNTSSQNGEPSWEQDRMRDGERPQHNVVLTRPMAMSATEVTIGQLRKFSDAAKHITLAESSGGRHG